LLLDEPTSALDIAHQLEVMALISALVKYQSLSVVMIVHDLNLAARYADQVIMINNGKIHTAGTPSEVFTYETIKEVYGVEADIQVNNQKVHITPLCCLNKTDHIGHIKLRQYSDPLSDIA
ncbi:MAG: ABC transporter ATP-binding protein, partial [Spirochaetes bacterium]|nr:ABC transporter ATP-binding protein [Spirochaetota bacterium]